MTDEHPGEPPADGPIPTDDLASFALVTDEGPEDLDVPDEPPERPVDSSARPEDGPQDVTQDPDPTAAP
jgi:hypothetical protein